MPAAADASPVVLNALALRPGGSGVQTYIRELLAHLPAAGPDLAFRAVVQADAVAEVGPGVAVDARPVAAGARRAVEGMRSVGPAALVHGLDVDLPLRPGAPAIATVHDLSVFDVPWAHSRARGAAERRLVAASVRRADELIAVSSFTAERIAARFGREATVILEAAGPDLAPPDEAAVATVRAHYGLPEVFVLHVGTIEPRKDVPGLAEACRAAGVQLVLAGRAGGVEVPAGARPLGYVPRAHLAALYGAATVVAYPSRYEGFGLPPLEAMACGAPVVATRTASLPEVLADGAELVAPGRPDELAVTLRSLIAEPERRAALAAAGRRRAASLSWDATAEQTVSCYRHLLGA